MSSSEFEAPLYIVIPVFNGWAQTVQCIEQLQNSSFQELKIILVDHGSTDDTKKEIQRFPDVIHLTESESLWWTGATNVGIRHALRLGATHIMLLNNDCYVVSDTIKVLIKHFYRRIKENHTEVVIAPVQRVHPDGKQLPRNLTSCFLLGYPTLTIPDVFNFTKEENGLKPTKLIIGGRGVIIPAIVFDRVGLFDEDKLPHYGADHDFYLRCSAAGIPLYLAIDAEVQIDQARTTIADNLGSLGLKQYLSTFTSIRSHRNIKDLSTLFAKHYPVKSLYFIGVALNIARYTAMYTLKRILFLFKVRH
ncbi:MAG: glycosyltransferase family 2 protein [bacterium]